MEFAVNTRNLRKGSLIFWQLGAPNLSPELVHLPTGSQKLLVNSILAKKRPDRPARRANDRRGLAVRAGEGHPPVGHNFASRTGDQVRNWDGDFMLRKNFASSRLLRVGVFGLLALTAAVIFTSDSAEARHASRRHHVRHQHSEEARDS